MPNFVALGHIVNDTFPKNHLGGSVSYAAVTALRLGYNTTIITKAPQNHPYIKSLQKMGISVHILPSNLNTITSFQNIYDTKGKRSQTLLDKQENITLKDLSFFPRHILRDAVILVAPVIYEVSMDLFPILAKMGFLAITPQGYFRKIDKAGKVHQIKWRGFEKYLREASIAIFSEEDINIEGKIDTDLLNMIKKQVLTVLTRGEKGATVFNNAQTISTKAFTLADNELVDFTGAGDTFATAFLIKYIETKDLKQSNIFANFYAANKIKSKNYLNI